MLRYLGLLVWAVVLMVGVSLLASLPVWLLWNWLVPSVFGLRAISWMEALGLLVLVSILFRPISSSSSSSSS